MSTSATVTQYYNNVLQRDPTASELSSFVAMIDSGALTSSQVLEALVSTSEAQDYAAQVIRFYQAAFGRVPDATGINGWVDQLRAGTTTTTDLALGFINSAEWAGRYGGTEVNSATISGLYVNVLGRTPSGAEVDAWIATGQSLDQVFIGFANSAEFKAKANTAVNNLLTNAGNTATADIATIYDGASALPVIETNGETFTLTANVDTVSGTANNDMIVATEKTFSALDTIDGGAGTDTLSIANASGSTITLSTTASVSNVEKLVVTNAADHVIADVQKWTGLQSISVVQNGTSDMEDVEITTKANVTSVSVTAGDEIDITDNGTTDTLASVSADGHNDTVTITSDALTALSLANNSQNATVTAAAATRELALTLNNVTGGTITDATATSVVAETTGAKSENLTINADKAKTLVINADEALSLNTSSFSVLETLTVTGDSLVTINAIAGTTVLTSIDASGSTGGLDMDAHALGDSVQFTGGAGADAVKLNASTKSTSMGAGDDSVTLSGSALGTGGSVDAGEGTDTLVMTAANAASASLNATFEGTISNFEKLSIGQVASGATNTVNLANLDDISHVVSAGAVAAVTAVAEVQTISVTGTATGQVTFLGQAVASSVATETAEETIDRIITDKAAIIAYWNGTSVGRDIADIEKVDAATLRITYETTEGDVAAIAGVVSQGINFANSAEFTPGVAAVAGGTLSLTNMANGGTLELTAAGSGANVTMTDATGSSDSINLVLKNDADPDFGTVSVAGVETVAITTDDTTDPSNGDQFTLSLTDAAAKTITVSGDAGLALTHAGTAVTSFDASGVTKGEVSWTTGALAGDAVLKGGAGNDTIDASSAAKTVDLDGGAGNDTLTGSSAKANTLAGGEGNDVLTGGSAADTITGGAGTDTIDGKGGLDTLTGGDGNDTFVTSVVATNGNTYATITDATAGDIVKSSTGNGTEVFTSTAITLASTAAFQDYLDAATAGNGGANSQIAWFQFGGNTYIVEDNSAAATFQNGADNVVALTGAIDLSGATFAAPGDWTLTIA